MTAFAFDISATDGAARKGRATTAHGTFETPCFMATGTAATVEGDALGRCPGDRGRAGNLQHLSFDAAADRRTGGASRRAA